MNGTIRDFVLPTAVLTVICLIVSAALSVTYSFANPVIEENQRVATQNAIKEVLPEGDVFDEAAEGLPEGVVALYTAQNGAGAACKVSVAGYGGKISMIVGVSPEGAVTGVTILEQSETQGLGSRVMDAAYTSQFTGKTGADEVDSISGSTISSKALKKGIQIALDTVKGGAA